MLLEYNSSCKISYFIGGELLIDDKRLYCPPFLPTPHFKKKKKSHIPHPYPHTPPPAPFISTTQSISSNPLIHIPPPSAPFISTNPFISPLLSTSSSPHPYPLPLPIYVCHILHPSQHPCYIRQRRSKPPSSKNSPPPQFHLTSPWVGIIILP